MSKMTNRQAIKSTFKKPIKYMENGNISSNKGKGNCKTQGDAITYSLNWLRLKSDGSECLWRCRGWEPSHCASRSTIESWHLWNHLMLSCEVEHVHTLPTNSSAPGCASKMKRKTGERISRAPLFVIAKDCEWFKYLSGV